MSFGKLVRRIVKKWLKRETEPEPSTDYDHLHEDPKLDRISPEPCMFCVELDGACSGDLNRNVHISDADGLTASGDGRRRRCVEYGGCADPSASESTERSCDSACRASRTPAPVCVCDACRVFGSPNRPSAVSTSSRITAPATAPATAGQAIADDVSVEENFCPYRCDVDSRFACGKFLKSGVTSSEMEDCGGGCRKSSVSLTSTARQIHSASGEKQHLAGNTEQQQQRLPETICPTADLPVSVVLSLDGEEGYARSQRRLRGRNQRLCYDAAKVRFHPPPNKTICHVTDYRNNSNVVS